MSFMQEADTIISVELARSIHAVIKVHFKADTSINALCESGAISVDQGRNDGTTLDEHSLLYITENLVNR